MNAKILHTIILSITMSSFLIPGIAILNRSTSPARPAASFVQEPAPSSQGKNQQVYIPVIRFQPADTNPVVVPAATDTPEPTAQPTPAPTQPAVTPTPVVKLPMENDYHSQRWETSTKNACGPTALLMVLDYYGQGDTLPQVIRSFKISPKNGGFDPDCNRNPVCLSPSVLEQVAQDTYQLKVVASDGWTFDQVYEALSNGQPVIADVTWRLEPGGTGHFVVIYGIDRENEQVYYHDPFDGADQTASWDEFSASWNGPVDAGDPLQPSGHHTWGMALAN
jgi:uncharacterized protein YvpB